MKNIINNLLEKKRKEALDKIIESKKFFDDTVQQALQDGGALSKTASDAKSYADAEFDRLLQEINRGTSRFEFKKIIDRAKEVAQYRAYVMPASELYIASRSLLDEIREWGIPAELLIRLEGLILGGTLQNDKEMQARHGLFRIISEYNSWNKKKDQYSTALFNANLILFLLMAVILIGAYTTEENYYSFLQAGLSGALASIILKSPPLNSYGALLSFGSQFPIRIASGFISCAICFGLLASKIVNIGNIASYTEDYLSIDYTSKVILISIGILTGFSERAIYSFSNVFETSIVPRKDRKKGKSRENEEKRE